MNKPTVVMVPVDELTPASYNPPARTDLSLPKNRDLMKSMLVEGLLYPILIALTPSGAKRVVEGHCRLAVGKALGWKEIACIVKEGSPESLYVHANIRSNLTNNDLLYIYLKKPDAVPARQRARLAKMEEVVGRDGLKALQKWGGSTGTFTQARAIARYVGEEPTSPFVAQSLGWLMAHNQTLTARKAMDGGIPPAQLRRAVADGKPLTLRMTAE